MSDKYKAHEKRMAEAIDSWYHGTHRSIRAVAIEFDVSRSTLTRRVHGGRSRSTRVTGGKALTEEQEQAVCSYMERLDQAEQSGRLSAVRDAANHLLSQAHHDSSTPPRKVSDSWTKRFVTRHPQCFKGKQNPVTTERENPRGEAFRRPSTPPPPPESAWHARTPRTAKEVIDFGVRLRKVLKDNNAVDEGYRKHVERFIKGAIANAHSLERSDRALHSTRKQAVSEGG